MAEEQSYEHIQKLKKIIRRAKAIYQRYEEPSYTAAGVITNILDAYSNVEKLAVEWEDVDEKSALGPSFAGLKLEGKLEEFNQHSQEAVKQQTKKEFSSAEKDRAEKIWKLMEEK